MLAADFDYILPENLIASYPLITRDQSNLLVLNRIQNKISDKKFVDILDYIEPSDLLVFNDSKVMQARLFGHKETGGKVELLVERILTDKLILAHLKANKSPKIGSFIKVEDVQLKTIAKENALYTLELFESTIWKLMNKYGHMPLPPYMHRDDELLDKERYQTVYSKILGSVAAPTAGLHFTEELLNKFTEKKIDIDFVTLHVGSGTFQPVRVSNILDHHMHAEYIEVSQSLCDKIVATKKRGNKVIAVGTTTVRSLESAALSGQLAEYNGETDIFIYPGKKFNVIDAMITNFHLPKSTLLMLVSAFAEREQMLQAYQHAIDANYRFFSYGDAMLIV